MSRLQKWERVNIKALTYTYKITVWSSIKAVMTEKLCKPRTEKQLLSTRGTAVQIGAPGQQPPAFTPQSGAHLILLGTVHSGSFSECEGPAPQLGHPDLGF